MTVVRSSPLQQEGRTILWARFHFTNGRWAAHVEDQVMRAGWPTVLPGWTVVRHVPKVVIWAKSSHASASKTHRVKYQLIATHTTTGERVTLTVFQCGQPVRSPVVVKPMPEQLRARCWHCDRTKP